MRLKDLNYAGPGYLAEQKFYRILLAAGYPKQVLRPESGLSARSHDPGADFFALAPGLSTDVMAAFEVKAGGSRAALEKWLLRMADDICRRYPGCAYYLVLMDGDVPVVKRYDVRRGRLVPCDRIPTYEELTANWLGRIPHIEGLCLRNVTVFETLRLDFARGLNVLIGENGFGKSTLLKVLYSQAKWASESARQAGLREKGEDAQLETVFGLPANALVSRDGNDGQAAIQMTFSGKPNGVSHVRVSQKSVRIVKRPRMSNAIPAVVFLQAHEILSTYRGYASLWSRYAENMSRDGTIIDTVNFLSMPALRSIPKELMDVCAGLEKSIGGRIELDEKEGTFYFVGPKKDGLRTPIDLTAEGWRKIGQLLVLLRNGAIAPGSILIWDEPEANLNPKLEKIVASLLIGIARSGVQLFIATHSLFFANELDIALRTRPLESGACFFNLKKGGRADAGGSLSEIDGIALIEESMSQSDRYLELD